MNPKFSVLTHTHSDCFDVCKVYFPLIYQFFFKFYQDPTLPHYVLTNKPIESDYSLKQILYDDKLPFSDRLMLALTEIETDVVMFLLEDYIPYTYADIDKINEYVELMHSDPSISFIRLIHSGVTSIGNYNKDLCALDRNHPYYFSTQVTLWRKDVLQNLAISTTIQTVRNEIETSRPLELLSDIGLFPVNKGKAVGGHHDSLEFPYIATACVAGKWNVSEYPILKTMLKDFNIDPNVRGCR